MARYFEISSSTPTVKLDTQGRGSVQYNVKNVSAADIDGRVVLLSMPVTSPASGAVQNGWVKLDGAADHHFQKDEQAVFSVKIEVPAKDRSKTGTYTFRLDSVLVSVPDRGDEGPATAFTVEGAAKPKPNMLLWLIPVIVLAVIGIGIGLWLALRNTGVAVPDVTGKSVAEAVAALTADKFTVDPAMGTATDAGADPNKVFSTTPAAGTKAAQGSAVHLTVGAAKAAAPSPAAPAPVAPSAAIPVPPRAVYVPPPAPSCAYGPGTCLPGYVWRVANPNDKVCVSAQVRSDTYNDNAQAAARRNPGGGAYGIDTCRYGFVWRDAFPNDHVCVTGATRSQAAQDNSAAASRTVCH